MPKIVYGLLAVLAVIFIVVFAFVLHELFHEEPVTSIGYGDNVEHMESMRVDL